MPDKAAKKGKGKDEKAPKEKEIVFTCKFCGETKPLSDLVVLRHYYPQLFACKVCARGVKNAEI